MYLIGSRHAVDCGNETFRRLFISALLILLAMSTTCLRVLSSIPMGLLWLMGMRLTCTRALRSPPLEVIGPYWLMRLKI
jgi:hypothetical protein